MNFKKMQIEVCKAMLKPNSGVAFGEVDDNHIAVTTDAVVLYVFQKNECIFNLEKIKRKFDASEILKCRADDKLLKKTFEMHSIRNAYNTVKFVAGDLEVWIEEKYAKNFNGYNFYAYAPFNRVLIKAPSGLLVAAVMPVRPLEG